MVMIICLTRSTVANLQLQSVGHVHCRCGLQLALKTFWTGFRQLFLGVLSCLLLSCRLFPLWPGPRGAFEDPGLLLDLSWDFGPLLGRFPLCRFT